MKNLLIIALISITTFANAQKLQESAVPAVVKTGFTKAHPKAKDVKWVKEGNKFEANFDMDKIDYSAVLDEKGNITETETKIPVSQLPKGVAEYVAQHHKGHKIAEAAKITDASGNVTYEAEVNKKDLIFDKMGVFIKENKEEKEY